ncbi:hypothetical protein [Ammoniphilus sp. 3BR4]|uniref:hypothetical protein n=1 Tax=Ammoniphilus sp. 3BR4 TaxID=3158265 RepID=UPI00346622EF
MIFLLASGISILASVTQRNRNNKEMWPQILQTFSPRRNNKWGMPVLLALGIGFIYILTRTRNNIGLQQMMQPFTNIMKNREMQEDLNQQIQYDGLAINDEMTIEEK